MLTIKRIPDNEIIKSIFDQTNKTISKQALSGIRNRIKRDSFHWYKTMKEGEYDISTSSKIELTRSSFYRRKHHEIIDSNQHNPQIQQTSLAELHRLSITLSNLYDVAPTIIGVGPNATISITPETKSEHSNKG